MTVSKNIYHKSGRYTKNCEGCGAEMVFKYFCISESRRFCSRRCYGKSALETREIRNQYGVVRVWSKNEDVILKKNYPSTRGIKKLAFDMGRTVESIHKRAVTLGLERIKCNLHAEYARGGQKNKGRPRPDFAKNSYRGFGKDNPFFGRKHSSETKKKMAKSAKLRNLDPEYHRKRFDTLRKTQKNKRHECPNKCERELIGILDEMFPNEYKFVGDWSFVLAGKNPDFVNVNGQKKIIELFGEIYHDQKSSPWKLKRGRSPRSRSRLFRRYGYETLIVWSRETKEKNLPKLKVKLAKFHNK